MQHLSALLAASDPQVVTYALTALVAVAKKPSQPNARFAGDEQLNSRLHAIASGWGGKEQGLDLLACTVEDDSSVKQVRLARPTSISVVSAGKTVAAQAYGGSVEEAANILKGLFREEHLVQAKVSAMSRET